MYRIQRNSIPWCLHQVSVSSCIVGLRYSIAGVVVWRAVMFAASARTQGERVFVVVHGRSLSDHRPSHPYNAGTEHVGFPPTTQALRALKGGGGSFKFPLAGRRLS